MTARERFLALDANTRKMVVFAAAIAGALCFLMMPSLSSLLPIAAPRGPSRKAAAPDAPGTVGGPGAAARALLGVWQGQGLAGQSGPVGQAICTIQLEIREKVPGQLAGYSTLTCIPLGPGSPPQGAARIPAAILAKLAPTSAILSGAWENGSAVRFTVDKNIGMNPAGNLCAMRSFTTTPFGASQLSAEWQDATCGGGQIMVRKVRQ